MDLFDDDAKDALDITGEFDEIIRDTERVKRRVAAVVVLEDGSRFGGFTVDLSPGGCFVAIADPPPRGVRCTLLLGERELGVAATVAHVLGVAEAAASHSKVGAGFAFDPPGAALATAIQALIEGPDEVEVAPAYVSSRYSDDDGLDAPDERPQDTALRQELFAEVARLRGGDPFDRLELGADAGPLAVRDAWKEKMALVTRGKAPSVLSPEARALAGEAETLLLEAREALLDAKRRPGLVEARRRRERDKVREGITVDKQTVDLGTTDPMVVLPRARAAREEGSLQEARALLDELRRTDKGDPEIEVEWHLTTAALMKQYGQTAKAEDHLRKALEHDPQCREAVAQLRASTSERRGLLRRIFSRD